MSGAEPIDFWFSIGSTYNYLTVARLAEVERTDGVAFRWRPFSVRQIISEIGNVPFRGRPPKLAYMWRDIERRAAAYGIPARLPAPYPLAHLDLANQVAALGLEEGWCADYVRATYRRWFVEGQEAGSEPNLSDSLLEIGQDPNRVVSQAQSAAVVDAYRRLTDEARRLGIFGAPSFVVRGELFWGDDRLADAIGWHRHGCVVF